VRDSRANLAMSSNVAVSSNVYYLPAPEPVAPPKPAPSRWSSVGRTWWRLRFAAAGIRLAFRTAPAPLFTEDETLGMLDGRAEMIDRRPRQTRPARVIDFDAARARLRP
jgi:hypothetical protein